MVLGIEIAPLQPDDVLWVARVWPAAAPIGIHRADPGLLQRANAGVAVLGRMRDLRGVDRGGRAHVDHAEGGHQHACIGVGGRIGRRERIGDIAIVVGIEQAVGEDAAQQALVEVVVGVNEARQHDAAGGVDHGDVVARGRDVGP